MSATALPSVLIVDDDECLRSRLARAFRDRQYCVYEAAGVAEAETTVRVHRPQRVVVDLRLGDDSGLDLVRTIREIDAEARIVVLTGYGSIATALEAMRLGSAHYLTKPADVDDIEAAFSGCAPAPSPSHFPGIPSLARVEWEHINRVLADCGGNVSEAARKLGLHRRSLQRKLARAPAKR